MTNFANRYADWKKKSTIVKAIPNSAHTTAKTTKLSSTPANYSKYSSKKSKIPKPRKYKISKIDY